ncbi:MAG TPA: HhH-GPD-type base excision DNA repair protein [Dermatophilaceae bacterium]|nr:HhH-GPD-type base excision DNA repair protein [Dermatophilaceae bacterium]
MPQTSPAQFRPQLRLTFDDAADELLGRDALALVLGMLLDQQMPMERAFAGAYRLATRMGTATAEPDGTARPVLSAARIAAAEPAAFEDLCATPPAVHRFPRSMAARIQALCAHVETQWQGDVSRLWATAASGTELRHRLEALPGFGPAKARIFMALLAKQRGVAPKGWEAASHPYGEEGFRSVADVVDRESLARVRQTKRAAKASARDSAQSAVTAGSAGGSAESDPPVTP